MRGGYCRDLVANKQRTRVHYRRGREPEEHLLIGVGILAARKLAQHDGGRPVPAAVAAISDAVRRAEEIMNEIDHRRPKLRSCVSMR